MKMINRALSTFAALAMPLLMVGCSEDVDMGVEFGGADEGLVSFGVTRASNDASDSSKLKIYSLTYSEDIDGEGTAGYIEALVRRYAPMSEMPEAISLVAGGYKATYQVGDYTIATFDSELLSYSGSSEFEVVAQESQAVEMTCIMENTVVRVEFDDTLNDNLLEGYTVTVMAADSYDESLIGVETTPQLIFESDNTGYFLMPSDVSKISWKFTGEKIMDTDQSGTAVEMTGVINKTERAEQTTLQFSYPKYLKVTESFSVYLDDSTEDHDDSFSFAPQPIITGDDLSTLQPIVGDVSYTVNVDSFLDIKSVCLTVDGTEIYPFNDSAAISIPEATFVLNEGSTTMGTLTINKALFDHFTMGGQYNVKISVLDSASVKGSATLECLVSGFKTEPTFDLWSNTSAFTVVDAGGSESVQVEYRAAGDETWIKCDDVSSSDGVTYSVKSNPKWEKSTNASGNTRYKMVNGITPNVNYEYRLVVDDGEYTKSFTSPTGGNQLANRDMSDSGNLAFTESSSGSTSWASGNNSYADDDLCSAATISGSACAKLTSTMAGLGSLFNKFAAGNIVYGQFSMGTTSGTVKFGQPFTWTARPQKFKLKYALSLGAITNSNTDVYTGSTDQALVFFAIVDWSGRHDVTAGTTSTSGSWNPEENMSVDKGKIIGYAMTYISESTATQSQFYDLELDVYYYDTTKNPSSSNISVVVSCASSAYGDYFVGSTSSRMWVDDFEIVY